MNAPAPTGGPDVLLVEDNDNDVDLTLRSFQKHGLANRVEVVNDGEAALDFLFRRGAFAHRAGEQPPKLVLLDLKLPKANGTDVLAALKADPTTKEIPVVVLTSSDLDRDVKQCYQLGANSYVVKPVDFAKFAKAVADVGMYWVFLNRAAPTSPQDGLKP